MTGYPEDLRDDFLREVDDGEVGADLVTVVDGLPPVTPPVAARAGLLASLISVPRFDRYAATVADLMDVGLEAARALLAKIDGTWDPGLLEGMEQIDIAGGPRVERAITGFIRLPGGAAFPFHEHVGDESVLILQGYYVDDDGTDHGPGEVVRMAGGTAHGFRVIDGGTDLVYLAVIQEGVRIGDMLLEPGDPRI